MSVERYLSNIPKEIIERSREEISKIVETIKNEATIKKIQEELKSSYKSIFTDGSNVVSERRGCGVVLFSSISILYNIENEGYEVLDNTVFGPKETLIILLPRFNLISRANSIMRGLEYLTAQSLIKNNIDLIVFDGSYVTSLLEPRKTVRDIYLDIRSMIKESHAEKFKDIMYSLVSLLDRELDNHIVSKIRSMEPIRSAKWFFENYYRVFEDIVGKVNTEMKGILKENLLSKIQNYIFLLIEQTFTASALANVLKIASERNIALIWVGKDTESRIVTREFKTISLSNDSVLMDFVLDPKTYLRVSDIAEVSEVSADKFTIADKGDINYVDRSFSVPMSLVNEIYVKFSEYEVVYSKLGGINSPTVQLTYPKNLMSSSEFDKLEEVMSILLKTSRFGYPEPLRVVHQRSTLRERSVKIISDGLYRACKDKNDIICALLRDSGRDLLI